MLIKKLERKGIRPQIIASLIDLLSNTHMIYQDERIATLKGTPQGSVLSPILFILYVNDLITEAEEKGIEMMMYGDDCIAHTSYYNLQRTLDHFKKWSTINKMPLNLEKSHIMAIRVSKRTQQITQERMLGIPISTHFK